MPFFPHTQIILTHCSSLVLLHSTHSHTSLLLMSFSFYPVFLFHIYFLDASIQTRSFFSWPYFGVILYNWYRYSFIQLFKKIYIFHDLVLPFHNLSSVLHIFLPSCNLRITFSPIVLSKYLNFTTSFISSLLYLLSGPS